MIDYEKENIQSRKYRWLLIACMLVQFVLIAIQVMENPENAFDENIRHQIYEYRNPLLNGLFIAITYMGNWQTITVLAVVLLALPKTRKNIGVPFAVISLSSTVTYKLVKEFFQRPRPELDVRLITQGGYSFPSGHSMNCMVCFGILIYLIQRYCPNKKAANILTVLLMFLIFGIGFSRIYVGVHFPTDVLGGWSLGMAFLMGSILILERIRGEAE